MRRFRVKFSFEAVEEQEIDVDEGDIVLTVDGYDSKQKWTRVTVENDADGREGFVPTEYLEGVDGEEGDDDDDYEMQHEKANLDVDNESINPPVFNASSFNASSISGNVTDLGGMGGGLGTGAGNLSSLYNNNNQPQMVQSPSVRKTLQQSTPYLGSSTPGITGRPISAALSSPQVGSASRFNQQQPRGMNVSSSSLALAPGNASVIANDEYAHIITKYDRAFQQIMHDRQSKYDALANASGDLSNRLVVVKEKANEVAEKLMEVNQIIQGERKRWKEKLGQDRQNR